MAFLLPGDLCDVHIFILKEMDHAIGILSNARVAAIPQQKIIEVFEERPTLRRALWWSTLVDEGTLREWLVNLGQRDARDRLAHLFIELWYRARAVGLVHDDAFGMPLTQNDLADTMGLTPVHVNRTLQQMRRDGLIELQRGRIRIPDIEQLKRIADFEPNYLHLERRSHGRD
jgi:CRP-like cAMP-binding protein